MSLRGRPFIQHYQERTKCTLGEGVQGRCMLFQKFKKDNIISAKSSFN